jgi:MacB-like periplasmic core domain
MIGRSFVPEEDRAGSAPVVILGHRLWQSRFGGDPGVVGRTISLDNHRYTVVGVLPAGFHLDGKSCTTFGERPRRSRTHSSKCPAEDRIKLCSPSTLLREN